MTSQPKRGRTPATIKRNREIRGRKRAECRRRGDKKIRLTESASPAKCACSVVVTASWLVNHNLQFVVGAMRTAWRT